MTISTTLPLAIAITAFALMSNNVQAAQLDRIQYDPPEVKVLGYDYATYAPIEGWLSSP